MIRHVRAGWDRYREIFNNPMFFAFLPELAGKTVIDLGCGEGRNTREFARRGAHLTGVDVSRKMIAAAMAAEAQEPLGISYREASFSDLSAFPAGGFDLAVSTMALMDGPDFEGAARGVAAGRRALFQRAASLFRDAGAEVAAERGRRRDRVQGRRVFLRRRPYRPLARFPAAPQENGDLFAMPRFPRRLETCINGLTAAGFRILKIQEPRPTEAMAAAHPSFARLRRHLPLFIYFAAEIA